MILHGHGLAIVAPKLSVYLDEETAPRIRRFGLNVMGVAGVASAFMEE